MATRLTPYLNFPEGTRAAMEYYRSVFGGELSGDDEDKLRGWWDALSGDGTVGVPLEKAPWGDSFGMCTDKFGVAWMVNITGS